MPTRIYLTRGEPMVIEEDVDDVAAELTAPAERLPIFHRTNEDGVVMVNPDHVVYIEVWFAPEGPLGQAR